MQPNSQADSFLGFKVEIPARSTALSAAAMARYLCQVDPASAQCFAEAMYEGAAWANEDWGAYWADVVRLIGPAAPLAVRMADELPA